MLSVVICRPQNPTLASQLRRSAWVKGLEGISRYRLAWWASQRVRLPPFGYHYLGPGSYRLRLVEFIFRDGRGNLAQCPPVSPVLVLCLQNDGAPQPVWPVAAIPAPWGPPAKPRGAGPGNRNRPRRRSRGVESGQQQLDPSMTPDIPSYSRRPPSPSTSVGQSHPHRPPCDSPPPSPRQQSHRRLASRRGPLPPGHWPDGGDTSTRPPLPTPGGKGGDGTPVPPWSRCPVRKFFQKFSSDKTENIPTTPRGIGPRAARISSGFWVEGLAGAGMLTEYPSGSVTCLLGRHSPST
jgi:hypothetical protein